MDEQREAGSGSIDVRWYFNFEKWHPTEEEWQKCLSLIPADEQLRIGRFRIPTSSGNIVGRHNPNAKSSLIGRLMLRKCAEEQLGLATKDQVWRRTTEGKPFLLNIPTHLDSYTSSIDGLCRAAYNMNLSHDGQLVAFVSGRDFVLGVDVMANNRAGSEPSDVFFPIFDENFTTHEWKTINAPSSEAAKFEAFFHHWTLKESYIKSVGYAHAALSIEWALKQDQFQLHMSSNTTFSWAGHRCHPNLTCHFYRIVILTSLLQLLQNWTWFRTSESRIHVGRGSSN
jgi:phosphopantetheinyl transferase